MKKKHINNIITLSVTILFTVIVLYNIDFEEMKQVFKVFDIKYFYILIPFFILIMVMRTIRWQILLPKAKYDFYNIYEVYMTSNLLNVFLPARAGDFFRAYYLGKKYKLSKMNLLGTVFAERILDGLTIVTILLIGILLYNKSQLAVKLAIISGVLFTASFITVLWIYKYNKIDTVCLYIKNHSKFLPENAHKKLCDIIDKLNPYINSFFKGFETFANPKTLLNSAIFSILTWGGDCLFIYILVLSFGIKASFTISLFIVAFISLSTIIPSSSIYVGLYQYAFILAAALYNVDKTKALSVAITQQAIMLAAYMIIAISFILRNHIKLKDINEAKNQNE